MYIFKYLPYIVLGFFTLKFIILFINENINALKDQIKCQQAERGLLSIKDIQPNNINRFYSYCEEFLKSHGYTNISTISKNSTSIDFISTLENEPILIRCVSCEFSDISLIDEFSLIESKKELELLLGKMASNSCKYGVLISNSNFSDNCLDFLRKNNDSLFNNHIKLIDGYYLTRYIRNLHKENIISEDLV